MRINRPSVLPIDRKIGQNFTEIVMLSDICFSGEFLQHFHLVIGLLEEDFHLTQCIKHMHEHPLPVVCWLCNKVP